MTDYQSAITHCDNCGCDWLDNGLNPIGCPYCKLTAQVAEIEALRAEVDALREALEDADNELDWLDEDIGIGCDHSAGVCTCDYWNMRRKMKAALSKETNND